MQINKGILTKAVENKIISLEQSERLYSFLQLQANDTPKFTFTHVLYYLGGFIAIAAMTVFMNLGWESFGGLGILLMSLLYAVIGLTLTSVFKSKGYNIPAGICATFVVCLTPLFIYGLQRWIGLWPDDTEYRSYHRYIQWHWLYMELGTLITGVVMAWRYKYPFLIMPIAVTLWYMSMDITAMITGGDITWQLRQLVSLYSGLLMIALAFWVDVRSRHNPDYAFWIYLFGVIAFWGGMSLQSSDSELSKFIYFCINLLMIGIGVLLVRRIFVVFGGLGAGGYLCYLASDVFKESWLFPFALTTLGLCVVYLGILWQKHELTITHKARALLPASVRELLDNQRLH